MDKTKITTVASIFAALAASLCCVGPIAIALLGLGSAGLFVTIGEYRPYIMGVTLVFLGLAFFFTYRKREVVCEDGTCKVQGPSRWNKIVVWFSAAIVAFLLLLPYLNFNLTASPKQLQANLATTVIDVRGMSCPACARGIEISLSKLIGVQEAKVDFDHNKAIVKYDEQKINKEQLINAVTDFGYDAKLSLQNQPPNK